MNELNSTLQQQYKPTLAIVVYKVDTPYNDDSYYLESHEVGDAGQLLEGRPLKTETIAGMVEIFRDKHQQETKISGTIPACLLHYTPGAAGDYKLIWHRPAGQKILYFTDETKVKSGLAQVPPMVFIASAAHLKVYTLSTSKRPGLKTKVYAGPYPNVDASGRVCLGSAKVKQPLQKTFENLITYWEEMFWGSKFSHVQHEAAVKGGMMKLWKAQLAKPERPFPMNLLPDTKITFQNIINAK